jgi:aspartate 1-decarboxylase
MRRHLMKSKIHRATITSADLHYEGSLTLDEERDSRPMSFPARAARVWSSSTAQPRASARRATW